MIWPALWTAVILFTVMLALVTSGVLVGSYVDRPWARRTGLRLIMLGLAVWVVLLGVCLATAVVEIARSFA